MRTDAYQIEKSLAAYFGVSGVVLPAGVQLIDLTLGIQTSLITAGFGGKAVPSVPFLGANAEGVVVTSPHNRVEIFESGTKERLVDEDGNEVFGRTVYNAGTFSIYFFAKITGGVEIQASILSDKTVDFELPYIFSFGNLPIDALVRGKTRIINDDPNAVKVMAKNLIDTASVTWIYNEVSNKLSAHVPPGYIQQLFGFHRIRFRVGDTGWPNVNDTAFVLHDCSGNPILNHVIIFIRERDEQWEGDDYTYDKTTGNMTVSPKYRAQERNVIYAFPEWLWALCNGQAANACSVMINDTDSLMISATEDLLFSSTCDGSADLTNAILFNAMEAIMINALENLEL